MYRDRAKNLNRRGELGVGEGGGDYSTCTERKINLGRESANSILLFFFKLFYWVYDEVQVQLQNFDI